MELLYLWINQSDNGCIKQQEFNFSPLYTFNVNEIENPTKLIYKKIDTINVFTEGYNNAIENITAVVGSNGVGKTTLLSYIAQKNCHYEFAHGDEDYEAFDKNRYELEKSIYVFINNGEIVIYHNLKHELVFSYNIEHKIFWNKNKEESSELLTYIRNQMIIYLTNSSIVPESLQGYSDSGRSYNVNMHPKSMNILASKFYNSLFGKYGLDSIKESDDDFAWIIIKKRDERTFQELLDILYYQFLISNDINDFLGEFRNKIYISFESIFRLIEDRFQRDFETIIESNRMEISKNKEMDFEFSQSQEYYDKIKAFFKKYEKVNFEGARQKNITITLIINLLFEAFFYNKDFILPDIDLGKDLYEQLKIYFNFWNSLYKFKYLKYIEEIEVLDAILSKCNTYENLIKNTNDLANKYDKVLDFDLASELYKDFIKLIETKFRASDSFVLRYIRIGNLEMSSGERAMQNMFSWISLMPELDRLSGRNKEVSEINNMLLLIDEIDLYSHPEWQRRTMYQFINTINKIQKGKKIQVIVTSHSPLILSDFPQQNIIYMNRERNSRQVIVEDRNHHKHSFGANIYTLLNDAFFLKNGAVGEYAKSKIMDIYKQITLSEPLSKENNYYQEFIDILGDNLIKQEMQKLLDEKNGSSKITITQEVPQNFDQLKKLKQQLENSLAVVNYLLGEDRNDKI